MVPAQTERLFLPRAAEADQCQPITLAMRAAHRLASCVTTGPCTLGNTTPLVSFSFDDVPDTAAGLGAVLLERFSARGTFFVSTGLLGRRMRHWRLADAAAVARLAAAGHEVGLHTHAHRPLAAMAKQAFAADFNTCSATLSRLVPDGPSRNFAYPFGFAHPAHRRCLKVGARSSRTTHPGLNVGRADLHFLKSWAFGASLHETAAVDRLLDEAKARGGWLIFTGHDVSERPSPYGCTPHLLAHALRRAAALSIAIVPIDRALDLCGAARTPLEPSP